MNKYIVGIREVHVLYVPVKANSPREAKIIANKQRVVLDDLNIEYSHDLDKNLWTVEKVE